MNYQNNLYLLSPKNFFVVFLTLFLNWNCSSKEIIDTGTSFFQGTLFKNNYELDFQSIMQIPYASIYVENGKNKSILILGNENNNNLAWFDAEKDGFITYFGKITGTFGMENDHNFINPPNLKDIFLQLKDGNHSVQHSSLVRFKNPETVYLAIQNTYSIKFENKSYNFGSFSEDGYYIIEEKFFIDEIKWRGSNFFWFNEGGDLIKSKQNIAPNSKKLYITTIKKFKK